MSRATQIIRQKKSGSQLVLLRPQIKFVQTEYPVQLGDESSVDSPLSDERCVEALGSNSTPMVMVTNDGMSE
jgi:hypothetical protein